jgi:hypothetical protein
LKALLKIVEGGTKPLHSEKVAPGKLVVDQSLPVPRLFEVRKKVFRVSETGGAFYVFYPWLQVPKLTWALLPSWLI